MKTRAFLAALAAFAVSACATPAAKEPSACTLGPADKGTQCTMQYEPVCGCDGLTYGNACMARASGVPEWAPGACEDASDPR